MTENKILMERARETLRGRWGLAIGAMLVWLLINMAIQYIPVGGWLLSWLISGPMALGLCIFTLNFSRNQNPQFEQIFEGFKDFGKALGTYLLMTLYILLWTLLLIVPGIIAALSYSMTFFILADNRGVGIKESLEKSKKMMDGYKWKLFCLSLRFIGWTILSVLTLGVGFLWLMPYMQVSYAKFYDDVKDKPSTV